MHFRKYLPYQPICVAVVALLAGVMPAQAASTSVSQTITPGLLTLTAPVSASLPPAQTNADADGTSQGSLGTTQVMDNRGTYAGWSLTATTSNFSQIKAPVASRIGSPVVTSSGTYTGRFNGQYTVTITTAGGLGVAQFQYSGLESDTSQAIPLSGNVGLGNNGVVLNFAAGAYQVGDTWTVETDTMPAAGISLTPASLVTIDGSPAGVHLGSAYQFSGSSDSATLLTADAGSGFGFYSATPTLRLTVPARTPIGSYAATLTETLN